MKWLSKFTAERPDFDNLIEPIAVNMIEGIAKQISAMDRTPAFHSRKRCKNKGRCAWHDRKVSE
jgi:hypothetical protein